MLVADDQREGLEYKYEAVFEIINEDAAALLPESFNEPFRGYLNQYFSAGYLTTAIKTQINDADQGALILNYAGHGATQFWAEPPNNIFKNANVAELTNAATNASYPFIISMSCEAGYFAYPQAWEAWTDPDSLAEAFMSSANGPAAAFMPTGMTTTVGQHILNSALFETFFTEDVRLLGDAIGSAKQQLLANGDDYYEQITNTFMLFGDPATALKVPLPRRPAQLQAQGQLNAIAVQWQAAADSNDQPVAGYNLYRATAPGGPYEKLNDAVLTTTAYLDTTDSPGPGAAVAPVAGLQTGTSYYYVVTSVAADGDASVSSAEVSATATSPVQTLSNTPLSGDVSSKGSKGCFIQTARDASSVDWSLIGIVVAIAVAFAVIRNGRRYKL
jgi:hypothetical protein